MHKFAAARLPAGGAKPGFTLDTQEGRDQVAMTVGQSGWDAYERPLPHYLFRTAMQWPGLVIDVGANTGFYTLLAVSAAAANQVIAFEPVPAILAILHSNVVANDVLDRVRLIRCGVSDRNGTAELYMPDDQHGLIETSASLQRDFKSAHGESLTILVRTLDRVLFRPSLVRKRVSIIKIDAEGHEAAVLSGAHWTIRRHRPIIFVEVLPGADIASMTRFLRRFNYRDMRLSPHGLPATGDDVEFDPDSWNHAFVPRERIGGFVSGG